MDEFRVKSIIEKTQEKISSNICIKEDIFALSFIKDEVDYKDLAEFLKEKLKGFKLYQDRYVESKKRKIRVNMNLQKEKNMW